jgi:1,4-dihydroxy-6-naphthoate synthase
MKITLGFSPCPNDTFIFDALIHHKIDTEGLEFEVFYEDVETLNQKAFPWRFGYYQIKLSRFCLRGQINMYCWIVGAPWALALGRC